MGRNPRPITESLLKRQRQHEAGALAIGRRFVREIASELARRSARKRESEAQPAHVIRLVAAAAVIETEDAAHLAGLISLPTRKGSIGNTTMETSWSKPRPAMAFRVTPTNSSRARTTVGIFLLSIRAAARPHAVAQAPQEALPTMTPSMLFSTIRSATSSSSMARLPMGNSVSAITVRPG